MSLYRVTVIVHDDATTGFGRDNDPVRRVLSIYSEDGSKSLFLPSPMQGEDDWLNQQLWGLFGGDA